MGHMQKEEEEEIVQIYLPGYGMKLKENNVEIDHQEIILMGEEDNIDKEEILVFMYLFMMLKFIYIVMGMVLILMEIYLFMVEILMFSVKVIEIMNLLTMMETLLYLMEKSLESDLRGQNIYMRELKKGIKCMHIMLEL